MKGKVVTIAALLSASSALFAQETVYLDKTFQWTTDKEKAVEYAVITPEKKGQVKVDFYMLDGRMKGIGHYSAYTPQMKDRVRNGVCTFLYPNGKDSLVSIYKHNKLEGQSTVYYPEGQTKLITSYKDGNLEGPLLQYYPDGKVRREEHYANNQCKGGKLFSAEGNELAFEPYFLFPQFPGGIEALLEVLKENIRYPQDAKIAKKEGRVLIQFIIDQEGKLVKPRVQRSVYPSLDQEAMRVIQSIVSTYQWSPGKIDGELKRISYTAPIMFRLPYNTNKK